MVSSVDWQSFFATEAMNSEDDAESGEWTLVEVVFCETEDLVFDDEDTTTFFSDGTDGRRR